MSDDIARAAPEIPENSDTWAIVEMMGRHRVSGRVSRDTQFGTDLLMLDVPFVNGFIRQFLGASSIFRMTICTEEVARSTQANRDLEPDISLCFRRWQDNELVKNAKETLSPDRDPDYSVGPVGTPVHDSTGRTIGYSVRGSVPSPF